MPSPCYLLKHIPLSMTVYDRKSGKRWTDNNQRSPTLQQQPMNINHNQNINISSFLNVSYWNRVSFLRAIVRRALKKWFIIGRKKLQICEKKGEILLYGCHKFQSISSNGKT